MNDTFSFLFIGVAGLLLGGFIFWKPYLGLAFMLCTLPVLIYSKLPAGLSKFTSITALFGLAALVFYIIRNKNFLERSRTSDKSIYLIAFLLFMLILVGILSTLVSTGVNYIFTYIQLIILMWLCEQLFTTPQKVENLMKWFVGANLVAASWGLLNFDVGATTYDINRLAGLQGNANEFAVYLSIAILMLIYFIMRPNKIQNKILLLLFTISLLVLIILSGSRGAILFLIPVISLQFVQFRRRNLFSASFIFIAIIGFVTIIVPYLPSEYIQRIVDIPEVILNSQDTVGLRFGLWNLGLELWAQKPIFGVGSGMFHQYSSNYPIFHGLPIFNTYLTYLVENGIIGLSLFLLLICRAVRNFIRVIRSADNSSPLKGLAITWQAIMLVILLNGIKGDWNTNKLLWISFAFSMILLSLQKETVDGEVFSEKINPSFNRAYQIK